MKKVLAIIFFTFLLVISCGKGKKTENQKMISRGEKYNEYIRIYNRMLTVNQDIKNYFEYAGTDTKVKVPTGKSFSTAISLDRELIESLKANMAKEPKMSQMDKVAKDIVPIMEEMLPVTNEIWIYYEDRVYLRDNYKKAQELHTKLLASSKKFERGMIAYRNLLENSDRERKKKDMKEFKKENQQIRYNIMFFMEQNEKVLEEIEKQKLDAKNFTKADVKKFKTIQKDITKAYNELKKVVVNDEFAKKEGFVTDDFAMFMSKATDFRAGLATFIDRIEKKDSASKLVMSDNILSSKESGTPENVYFLFNEMIKEHNNLLSKKNR